MAVHIEHTLQIPCFLITMAVKHCSKNGWTVHKGKVQWLLFQAQCGHNLVTAGCGHQSFSFHSFILLEPHISEKRFQCKNYVLYLHSQERISPTHFVLVPLNMNKNHDNSVSSAHKYGNIKRGEIHFTVILRFRSSPT